MSDVVEGAPAPDFEAPTDGGGMLSLSDLEGRKAVLFFYPKDDTSGCTKEAGAFSEAKDAFDAAGTTVVGISVDGPASHDRFKAKHGLDLALVSDEDHAVVEAYGVWVEKSMYGRKYMGTERATFLLGPDGTVLKIWRKVKVPGHVDEVLKAAQAA